MFKSILNRLFWTNVAILLLVMTSVSVAMTAFLTNYVSSRQYDLAVKTSSSIEYLTVLLQIESNDFRSQQIYNSTLASWAHLLGAEVVAFDLQEHRQVFDAG